MRRLPAVLALVAVAAGCGSDPGLPDLSESIECRVPCETVTDWVSYADHVAYIDVTFERELPFEQLEGDPEGNGYVPREVTAETGDVLWTRDGAPALPAELTWGADGWAIEDGKRLPLVYGVRVEVGERYLAVLMQAPADDRTGPVWYPLAADALFTVDGDGVPEGTGPDTPARAALVGESPAAIAAELAATAADPVAARYFDLDPIARYEAVVRETEG
ncbi:hypothetical protein [Jiangella alkaliphila]|uniref:Uncharacterized protein n=1 Tax=Jiangella alkaliphila TaxID=419479 RepID=A0A1H2JF83_9ACTN|nr:hypothetical protein [Jiangella alkaliphila]SDU55144.1 hypothetical protein SAMN04488563_2641 [Jiangella alkaliphila]